MTIIDPGDLDPTSSYKLLIGSVLPRAIAWVSTGSTDGVGNVAPVSFFTVVGRFPPVLSITLAAALRRGHAQGHVRQHPRHQRIRRQHRHDRPGRRCAPVCLRIRQRRRRVRGTRPEEGALRDDLRTPHRRRPDLLRMRRRPHHSDAAVAGPCRVGTRQAHPHPRRSLPAQRAHRRRRAWACSADSRASTRWSTTSSPRHFPTISSRNSPRYRASRLDGHASDYSPIDTAEWSPSGSTKAAS